MSSYIKAGSEPNNRIPGSVNPNKGRGRDLLTNKVKVQLLMACRCSSLLFPTTSLFPPRQRGVFYSSSAGVSFNRSSLLFAPSTRLLFASSIHRVQLFHSAVQVYCSRVAQRGVFCVRESIHRVSARPLCAQQVVLYSSR